MSRLDDIIDYADEFGSIGADEARVELAALRAALADAQRERDEARARVAELEANIIECDAMTNIDRKPRNISEAELAIVRMACEGREAIDRLSELEQAFTLTPRRCVTCAREAACEMRENAESICRDWNRAPYLAGSNFGGDSIPFAMRFHLADAIRALPLPAECADCNPLKPETNRHGCNCPCGCDAQATKQDDHGAWWCESCYLDYIGIEHNPESEATR